MLSACRNQIKKISGWEDPLEKGIAAHSSIIVWRIPWKKELGMLQSVGSLMSQTWLQWFVLYPCNGYKTDLELWSYPCPWVNWGKFFLRSKKKEPVSVVWLLHRGTCIPRILLSPLSTLLVSETSHPSCLWLTDGDFRLRKPLATQF